MAMSSRWPSKLSQAAQRSPLGAMASVGESSSRVSWPMATAPDRAAERSRGTTSARLSKEFLDHLAAIGNAHRASDRAHVLFVVIDAEAIVDGRDQVFDRARVVFDHGCVFVSRA